jgi:hypothetical protein
MKRRLLLTGLGLISLVLAACDPRPEEIPPPPQTAPEEELLGGDAAPAGQESVSPSGSEADQPAACVIATPAGGACTKDINACGKASMCECDEGYNYNAALGMCILSLQSASAASAVAIPESDCAMTPTGVCTRDINMCGQPSVCHCNEGFEWNAAAGKCLRDLTANSE